MVTKQGLSWGQSGATDVIVTGKRGLRPICCLYTEGSMGWCRTAWSSSQEPPPWFGIVWLWAMRKGLFLDGSTSKNHLIQDATRAHVGVSGSCCCSRPQ